MQNTDTSKGRMALLIAGVLFAIFVANLFVAGILRQPAFLTDVLDMLSLFLSVGFFVLGMVQREVESEA
jgi:hypothetical protein